jgi:uncharacterized protein GlcG (DUF336 family)
VVAWLVAAPPARAALVSADVERIIAQAASEAEAVGLPVSIAVVDHEGNVLGAYQMGGARPCTVLRGGGRAGDGLEGLYVGPAPPACDVPPGAPPMCASPAGFPFSGSALAAISKAGTAAFFSTQGNAFTTRTAGFIIQQHFPPTVQNASSGPLFGVQLSSLPCGDVNPKLPLGLSADPGGLPLYKDGQAAGGVGVEGDGTYTAVRSLGDRTVPPEERIALAGTRGFEAPAAIRGDQILVGGLRFPFANAGVPARRALTPFSTLTATGTVEVTPHDSPPSQFLPQTLGGVRGTIDPHFFPPIPSTAAGGLAADDVTRILTQGARRADRLRAAIRRPLGDRARVNMAVVDAAGEVLGVFRTADAPVFGFDVSVQKARSAAFFSSADAAALLRAAPTDVTRFVDAAAADGLRLDGRIAFADRTIGFLARPFFPDGIEGTRHGPFSLPIGVWSVFNDGLQAALVTDALCKLLMGITPSDCTGVPGLANGIQIFPGSVPLYRGRRLVGAIGVSGDGVDQDDAVAAAASRGFAAPRTLRADRVRVRGVRLPFVKLPRNPTRR